MDRDEAPVVHREEVGGAWRPLASLDVLPGGTISTGSRHRLHRLGLADQSGSRCG